MHLGEPQRSCTAHPTIPHSIISSPSFVGFCLSFVWAEGFSLVCRVSFRGQTPNVHHVPMASVKQAVFINLKSVKNAVLSFTLFSLLKVLTGTLSFQ